MYQDLEEGLQVMQEAIDAVTAWSHKWGLKLSQDKTKAMIFSRRRRGPPTPLQLDGINIKYVKEYKFWGLVFDKSMT